MTGQSWHVTLKEDYIAFDTSCSVSLDEHEVQSLFMTSQSDPPDFGTVEPTRTDIVLPSSSRVITARVIHPTRFNRFSCSKCDNSFVDAVRLSRHEKLHDQKQFNYKCAHCGRKFYHKTHFIGHVNKHKGVRPFACDWCLKAFTYKSDLIRHKSTCQFR